MQSVRCIKALASALVMILALAATGFCGFVITEADSTQTLVAKGKVKSLPADVGEPAMIMDLNTGDMILLDPSEKTAAKTSVDEFCSMMKQMAGAMAEAMEQLKAQGMAGAGGGSGAPGVRIEKAGAGGKIAGYETQKYNVYAGGELYEELWISSDKALLAELGDMEMIARFEQCAGGMMGGPAVETDPAYLSLMRKGWVLRSVSHDMGTEETVVDVERIEKKEIAGSAFEVPAGYEMVPFEEMFGME